MSAQFLDAHFRIYRTSSGVEGPRRTRDLVEIGAFECLLEEPLERFRSITLILCRDVSDATESRRAVLTQNLGRMRIPKLELRW